METTNAPATLPARPQQPLHEYLRAHARERPGHPACIWYGAALSWAELDAASDAFGARLQALGGEPPEATDTQFSPPAAGALGGHDRVGGGGRGRGAPGGAARSGGVVYPRACSSSRSSVFRYVLQCREGSDDPACEADFRKSALFRNRNPDRRQGRPQTRRSVLRPDRRPDRDPLHPPPRTDRLHAA